MGISDLSKWIEHLKEPLVLAGFAIMLVAGLMRALINKNIILLTKRSSEKIIRQLLLYAFILGAITILLSFTLALIKENTQIINPPIIQETIGEQSPSVTSKKGVEIRYGDMSDKSGDYKDKNNGGGKKEEKKEAKTVTSAGSIKQTTKGGQSPAVVSGHDVKIHYEKKE